MSVNIEYQKAVSIANFIDKTESENEDYISMIPRENDTYVMWNISDGAGGAGTFCKEWANYLGETIPLNPEEFSDGKSSKWFDKVSIDFFETVIAKKDLTDLMLQKKVFKDGSYSTLSSCWIDKQSKEIFFSSVGDSCIFYFENIDNKYQLKFITSLNKQNEIDDSPKLLNWNIERKDEFPFDSIEISNEFKIIVASDTLAKWVLLNLSIIDFPMLQERFFNQSFLNSLNSEKYEERKINIKNGSNISTIQELFIFLKVISNNKEKYKNEMMQLHSRGEIEIDDFSLIYIEGNVSNEKSI